MFVLMRYALQMVEDNLERWDKDFDNLVLRRMSMTHELKCNRMGDDSARLKRARGTKLLDSNTYRLALKVVENEVTALGSGQMVEEMPIVLEEDLLKEGECWVTDWEERGLEEH